MANVNVIFLLYFCSELLPVSKDPIPHSAQEYYRIVIVLTTAAFPKSLSIVGVSPCWRRCSLVILYSAHFRVALSCSGAPVRGAARCSRSVEPLHCWGGAAACWTPSKWAHIAASGGRYSAEPGGRTAVHDRHFSPAGVRRGGSARAECAAPEKVHARCTGRFMGMDR